MRIAQKFLPDPPPNDLAAAVDAEPVEIAKLWANRSGDAIIIKLVQYGNDPDSHSCQCPPEILEKYGIRRKAG